MQTGQKIRDYILEEKIGQGGMGEVWRARHTVLNREVAIKVMARQLAADPQFEERFLQEARAQAALQHPRILGLTDFFSENGIYYLVMPLVIGETLAQRLARSHGPLPLADVLAIARDLLDALDYAHQRGIIHRDVKPANVMLDRAGHAHLMDFGIALPLGQQRLTRTGTSMGTIEYISPEQIRNPKKIDHRTDVYSVGCVLYEMLAGRPPFLSDGGQGDTDFALKEAHMYQVPPPITSWNKAVPQAVDALVLRALEKDPDRRFGGCGEFRRALEVWDRTAPRPITPLHPTPAPAPQPPQPLPPPTGKTASSWRAGIVVAVLVLLVALGAYLSSKKKQEPEAEPPPVETPAAPTPQPPQESSAVRTLLDIVSLPLAAGYARTGDHFDALAPAATDNLNAELQAGEHYIVAAVCDSSCSDLDLRILDGSGTLLQSDTLRDDHPVVQLTAPSSGKFALQVVMAACSASKCQYGVGLFRKNP